MGIIILPLLLGALALGIMSSIKTIKQLRTNQVGIKELILGLLVSIIIFGMICLSYLIRGEAWGLSPAFRIPIFMIFIPYVIYIYTKRSENPELVHFSKIILISIGISTILGVIFNDIIFELIDHLGIEKHY